MAAWICISFLNIRFNVILDKLCCSQDNSVFLYFSIPIFWLWMKILENSAVAVLQKMTTFGLPLILAMIILLKKPYGWISMSSMYSAIFCMRVFMVICSSSLILQVLSNFEECFSLNLISWSTKFCTLRISYSVLFGHLLTNMKVNTTTLMIHTIWSMKVIDTFYAAFYPVGPVIIPVQTLCY